MNKLCRVVMLPTKEASSLGYHFDTNPEGSIDYAPDFGFELFDNTSNRHHKPQYLYMIFDEEIKEGDWYLNGKYLYQADRHFEKANNDKKIIATTDELHTNVSKCFTGQNELVSQISKSFVKDYAKANGIDEVLVEFEEYMSEGWVPTYNNPDNHNLDKAAELEYRLKFRYEKL